MLKGLSGERVNMGSSKSGRKARKTNLLEEVKEGIKQLEKELKNKNTLVTNEMRSLRNEIKGLRKEIVEGRLVSYIKDSGIILITIGWAYAIFSYSLTNILSLKALFSGAFLVTAGIFLFLASTMLKRRWMQTWVMVGFIYAIIALVFLII